MRFVVLGAGAIGGYWGARLAKAGSDVFLLARGENLQAIRSRGITIEQPAGTFTVRVNASEKAADAGRADVLIVAVKAYDTVAAVEPCRELVAPDACVLTVQNGLGNLETLNGLFGASRVLGGVARGGGELVEPGRVRLAGEIRAIVGEQDGRITPRLERIRDAFEHAAIGCELSTDIARTIWEKLVANSIFNVITAIFDCEVGEIRFGEKRDLAERAIDELLAVARAKGIDVRPEAVESCWQYCDRHPTFPTSTAQDVARGKPLEVQALSGGLVEEARRAGVPVPTHEMFLEKLRSTSRPSTP